MREKQKLQQRLVHFARKHLGKPYKFGARPHEAPRCFDCSSFVQYLYQRIGIDLPRTCLEQVRRGRKIDPGKEKLEPGDLIFIKGEIGRYDREFPQGVGHVVVYTGEEKIIHAPSESIKKFGDWLRPKKNPQKDKVCEEAVAKFLNRQDLVAIKRII